MPGRADRFAVTAATADGRRPWQTELEKLLNFGAEGETTMWWDGAGAAGRDLGLAA